MSNSINPLAMVATTGLSSSQSRSGKGASWFEVMADAWGKTLDAKASEIEAAGMPWPTATTSLPTSPT